MIDDITDAIEMFFEFSFMAYIALLLVGTSPIWLPFYLILRIKRWRNG